MPFLAAIIPAAIGAAGAAAGGAAVDAIGNAISGDGDAPAPVVNQQQVQGAMQNTQEQIAQSQGRSTKAYGQQQNLANALAKQGGIQNQSSVFNQQQGLANQLGQMAQGQGPSVAQAQLNNTTGQNVANQAALMAGQRGAGANAGLLARQAAQQGGAIQQQAAGQGAALKAQEQLNAIGALQQQQNMLGGLATQQVGQQTGAVQNLNQNALQNQQLAAQAALQNQQQILGAASGTEGNQAAAARQNDAQAQQNMQGIAGGVGSAIVSGLTPKAPQQPGSVGSNKLGNQAQALAEGGQVSSNAILKESYGPKSKLAQHLYAKGGNVMRSGGPVPGKPKVSGAKDSYSNDTVDAKLSPGEIVLPRSVTKSSDPIKNSAEFVAAVLAGKGPLPKKAKK